MKNCTRQFDRPRRIEIRALVALAMLLGMMSAHAAPVSLPRALDFFSMTSAPGHAHVTAPARLPGASAAAGTPIAWDRVGSPVNGIQTAV